MKCGLFSTLLVDVTYREINLSRKRCSLHGGIVKPPKKTPRCAAAVFATQRRCRLSSSARAPLKLGFSSPPPPVPPPPRRPWLHSGSGGGGGMANNLGHPRFSRTWKRKQRMDGRTGERKRAGGQRNGRTDERFSLRPRRRATKGQRLRNINSITNRDRSGQA